MPTNSGRGLLDIWSAARRQLPRCELPSGGENGGGREVHSGAARGGRRTGLPSRFVRRHAQHSELPAQPRSPSRAPARRTRTRDARSRTAPLRREWRRCSSPRSWPSASASTSRRSPAVMRDSRRTFSTMSGVNGFSGRADALSLSSWRKRPMARRGASPSRTLSASSRTEPRFAESGPRLRSVSGTTMRVPSGCCDFVPRFSMTSGAVGIPIRSQPTPARTPSPSPSTSPASGVTGASSRRRPGSER